MSTIGTHEVPFYPIRNYGRENMVYVCSRFSGDEATNLAAARRYSRYVVEMGKQPVTSHLLYPQFMNDAYERETAMDFSIRLLLTCGELWVFGDGYISDGMQHEIMTASKYGIPILFQQEGYEEWNGDAGASVIIGDPI